MNTSQATRYYKLSTEPFYLLNKKYENGQYIFDMSGSKQDIYTVTIFDDTTEYQGKITCNCPDMNSWAKRQHVVCKHCCFILFKVLKCFIKISDKVCINHGHKLISTEFFNELEFELNELDIIKNKFDKITLTNSEYTDNDLLEKYNKLMNDVNTGKATLSFKGEDNTKNMESEDECPICSCLLLENDDTIDKLLACPICHAYIHKECMDIWIKHGHNTCVYCRSDIWKKYFCPLLTGKIIPTINNYKNLNDIV
jgi:hypothetical protein